MKLARVICACIFFGLTSCAPSQNLQTSSHTLLPPPTPPPVSNSSPNVIVTNQINTWAVATDDANVYWTDCGTNPSASDGRVLKMSKAGVTPIVLAAQQPCPADLALDADNVFYLASDTNSTRKIMRVSKTGGTPAMLIGGMDIRSIAADANAVYWTTCDPSRNTGAIMKLQSQSNAPITLDSGKGCFFDVAVDASGVYWIDDRGVMRLAPTDKTATNLTPARFHPRNLIADANNLYWVGDNYILRLSKNGGEPSVLVSSENGVGAMSIDAANIYWASSNALYRIVKTGGTKYQIAETNFVSHLAIDETNVYWTNNADKVTRVAKASGVAITENKSDPQTLAFAQEGLNGLAVDETNVYWTTCRYVVDKYFHGGVFKTAKNGGDVIALAQNQTCPGNLALDADNVYWVNQGVVTSANDYQDGTILKIGKSGGAPVTLATAQSGRAMLAVDDTNVYWTACGKNRGVMKQSKSGGTPMLWIDEKDCPTNLAIDATSVYWIGEQSIKKADKPSGATQVVATSGGSALAIDEAFVYWTRTEQTSRSGMRSCADERSVLMKTSKSGGTPTTLGSFTGTAPGKIAVSATSVYYGTDCTQGIARVAKTGGTPAIIAPNQIAAQIAIDATSMYWTVYASGAIRRSSQPK